MGDDHGYGGNYINSIIDLTDSEKVLESCSYNGLCARWIDYNKYNKKCLACLKYSHYLKAGYAHVWKGKP